ncbi:MAG: DUF3429 family protein [Alphaproteobacteria bacterium]|nr:DUF3429 family protein [Alphaproteobacteria bacterium]
MPQPIAPPLQRPRLIGALVLSGCAPILALTSAAMTDNGAHAVPASHALVAYCAVVVGFLGGLRWGAELRRAPSAPNPMRLTAAAAATVVGWAALLLPTHEALFLLLATAGAQLAWDLRATQSGHLPAWVGPLRVGTAALSGICLVAVAAAVLTD